LSTDTGSIATRLQDALGDSYTFERELGGGAMSRVFVALEKALGRRVVIKALPPELAEGMSPERFRREILVAARLQHPHIVPVLTAGDAAGVPYYTMPFVPGESLRHRLSERGRLPVAETLAVLRDVARALVYAHHEGVVHRDIKPENVLLHAPLPGSDAPESAVVTDFGIARALSSAIEGTSGGVGDSGRLTQLGMTLGTPTYMAPEQAVGEEIDHRADIYAFGVMAYELAAGVPPFIESSTQRLMVAHLTKAPAHLSDRVGGAPPAFYDLVMRCIEKEPGDRPQAMVEVLRVLDRLETDDSSQSNVALSVSCVAPAIDPSVAVLPFVNLSADADAEYFSDGITEEVLNALTRVAGLRVAARTSAFAFKGQQVGLRDIAEQLGVHHVLEGSVRRSGNRVRVSVQLVSAADGLHLWGERYDRDLSDVFAIQDEIAGSIAMALGERLTSGETPAVRPISSGEAPSRQAALPQHHARHGALNVDAYEKYLRGRFLFEQHDHRVLEALHCCESAASIDPEFALAHAWTGLVYSMLAAYQVVPAAQAFERARAATERALAINPNLAEALAGRAMVALWHEWDRPAAESLAARALAAAPGLGIAHEWVGWVHLASERFPEAEASMSRALELDPLNTYSLVSLAFAQIMGGNAERALRLLRGGLARSPGDAELHRLVGLALASLGSHGEAAEQFARSRELNPANAFVAGNLASALALGGNIDEARELALALERGAREGTVPAAMVALARHALGEHDSAFEWLERSVEAREFWLSMMHVDREFARMRADPRFDAIVARVGVKP
jgi:eukaryotic-like serine/threonine-protein kinase